jgi:replicative DNA helicase
MQTYDKELEKVIIGQLIVWPQSIFEVEFLKPEHFFDFQNAALFEAFTELNNDFQEIDYMSLYQKVKQINENISIQYISGLTTNIGSSRTIKSHARKLFEYYSTRQVLKIQAEAKDKIKKRSDIGGVVIDSISELQNILAQVVPDNTEKLQEIAETYKAENKALKTDSVGIPTFYRTLDANFHMNPGNLIVIGAGTSHGKTLTAINIARNIADNNIPVSFFSLEMKKSEIANRIISNEISLPNFRFKHKLTESELKQYDKGQQAIKDYPLYVSDESGLTVSKLVSLMRKQIQQYGIKVFFVDYLQLILSEGKHGTREQEVAQITRALKVAAMSLDVVIVALSQFNRSYDIQNRVPKISDLRESGAIEQDADSIILVYWYFKAGLSEDGNGNNTDGKIMFKIDKQRGGSIFTIPDMKIEPEFQRITDPADAQMQEFMQIEPDAEFYEKHYK